MMRIWKRTSRNERMVVRMTFEQGMERLEEIVERLESGDAPLDESLKLLSEGVKLTETCGAKLQKAEQAVAALGQDGAQKATKTSEGGPDHEI